MDWLPLLFRTYFTHYSLLCRVVFETCRVKERGSRPEEQRILLTKVLCLSCSCWRGDLESLLVLLYKYAYIEEAQFLVEEDSVRLRLRSCSFDLQFGISEIKGTRTWERNCHLIRFEAVSQTRRSNLTLAQVQQLWGLVHFQSGRRLLLLCSKHLLLTYVFPFLYLYLTF